jgi:hypothetical protein
MYVVLSPFERTTAFAMTLKFHNFSDVLTAGVWSMYRGTPAEDWSETPALMVEAPLSNTRTTMIVTSKRCLLLDHCGTATDTLFHSTFT